MEVVSPLAATDFHFDSTCSTPYVSAPSSPKAFGNYYSYYSSAPTSPTRASAIYSDFFSSTSTASSPSRIMPFDWEDRSPRRAELTHDLAAAADGRIGEEKDDDPDGDFAFDFSGRLSEASFTAAEELFDHGKIRPLKPPPRLQLVGGRGGEGREFRKSPNSSPKSPSIFRNVLSPRKRRDFDPFAAAIEKTTKGSERERGREREVDSNPSNSTRRAARSLSPLRTPDSKPSSSSTSSSSTSSSYSFLKGSGRKWRLRDLLLFRSASEGRATDKDTLRKFGILPKKGAEDVKNASFRSTEGSVGSVSSRRGPVSAHELHYTKNRAVSEEMKRKTFLPYKQGLLGCLGFNPTVHGIANGFDVFRRV